MQRLRILAVAVVFTLLSMSTYAIPAAWSDASPHKEGFVTANGIRLQYLDWGGSGPALILIHGADSNPHVFDDLAPAFTDRFHVIAYAVRGYGRSDARGPYDTATQMEDLRGLMDALGITKAHLVGWSAGGADITAMAANYPERVGGVVYFDSYSNYSDPDVVAVLKARPSGMLETPLSALASLDAYLSYEKATNFTALDDMRRIEACLRAGVDTQPDGSLRLRISNRRTRSTKSPDQRQWDYTQVHSPILAIYAESVFDTHVVDAQKRAAVLAWEQKYMAAFRAKSIERIRRQRNVEVLVVPGTHDNFFLISREKVVRAMRRFLGEQ